MVPGRTSDQCRQRWICTLDPAHGKKDKWKPEEDTKLAEAVTTLGKNWIAVAALVPNRTNRQCRTRWVGTVDPANGQRGKLKPEEDSNLIEAVKKHGNHWVAVAKLVPGQTYQHCRQRWVHTLDPDRASNTVEEEHDDGNDKALVSVLV
jgi:hypothetical protein